MTLMAEGDLQITIPEEMTVRKFDGEDHGLSHCMKAVDFIVEQKDRFLFIEFKDPQHPKSRSANREEFIDSFLSGKMIEKLKQKFRDTFLYEWASARPKKPIYYYVLVALETLTAAELITCTDELKRKIPTNGPPSGGWRRKLVEGCAVFNIASWNEQLSAYPVSRLGRSSQSDAPDLFDIRNDLGS